MTKRPLILFVGDNTTALSEYAKKNDSSAELILSTNVSQLDQISVGYISVTDHKIADFIGVLEYATEIYYVPSDTWDISTQMQTELHLQLVARSKPVYNLTHATDNLLDLVDLRKTNSQQLWVAGCSITAGVGVKETETYGHILAQSLGLPVSILAEDGSSISWAADQILRSDIRKDDIVVWGITGVSRMPLYTNNIVTHITSSESHRLINTRLLVSDHMLYLACTAVEQVIKHASTVGYKLVLTQFPLNSADYDLYMLHYLTQHSFFVHNYNSISNTFIDLGSDNIHPGPLQHQYYANLLLDYIKNENLS